MVNPGGGNGDEKRQQGTSPGTGPLRTTANQTLEAVARFIHRARETETNTMTLGTFTPRTRITGDKIDLRQQQWYNRPMLMRCNEYSDQFTSKMKQNAKVEAVWADVVDLASGTILINVLFTNGAIVDNLKEYAGTETTLPVKIVKQAGGQYGGYAVLEALTEQEQAAAGQWYQQYWGLVDQERAKREAASRPLQNAAPGGFAPANVNTGPSAFQPQGQVPPASNPVQTHMQPQQGQFGQPTQGFGQVAQGGAPGQFPAQQLNPQQVAAGMGGSAEYGAPPQGQQLPHDQGQFAPAQAQQAYPMAQGAPQAQFQQAGAPGQYVDPNQGQAPAFGGGGAGQFAPAQQVQQGNAGQAPGMFTDAPPPADPNQGFAAPNAQNMLAQLNNQLG